MTRGEVLALRHTRNWWKAYWLEEHGGPLAALPALAMGVLGSVGSTVAGAISPLIGGLGSILGGGAAAAGTAGATAGAAAAGTAAAVSPLAAAGTAATVLGAGASLYEALNAPKPPRPPAPPQPGQTTQQTGPSFLGLGAGSNNNTFWGSNVGVSSGAGKTLLGQ
jgi:hypothetical protein